METNINGKRPVSIVDPEAHSMQDKNEEWGFNYNFQSGVDDKYGMIAVHYITQSPNDKKELLITVNELNERLGREKLCYCSSLWILAYKKFRRNI